MSFGIGYARYFFESYAQTHIGFLSGHSRIISQKISIEVAMIWPRLEDEYSSVHLWSYCSQHNARARRFLDQFVENLFAGSNMYTTYV